MFIYATKKCRLQRCGPDSIFHTLVATHHNTTAHTHTKESHITTESNNGSSTHPAPRSAHLFLSTSFAVIVAVQFRSTPVCVFCVLLFLFAECFTTRPALSCVLRANAFNRFALLCSSAFRPGALRITKLVHGVLRGHIFFSVLLWLCVRVCVCV